MALISSRLKKSRAAFRATPRRDSRNSTAQPLARRAGLYGIYRPCRHLYSTPTLKGCRLKLRALQSKPAALARVLSCFHAYAACSDSETIKNSRLGSVGTEPAG